jgi:alkanesulfonate monooxygenase SsuD/methylene tetrahydromethanopterin reductase-like flavin-dependent oxidoreductase (luciferase family)
MKIGMNIPVMVPGLTRDLILEWCRRVDIGPFSSIAAGERITFPNPEVMVTLSAAAAVTTRVTVSFSVLVAPMHDPVLIAKQIATLDVISGGRVSLGLGVGAREEDYRAVGARWDDKLLSRLDAFVSTVKRVWLGENVVDGAQRPVEPLPVQKGGPELLAGVLMPQATRRAARWADGISSFSFGPTAEDVGGRFETARAAWREAGRERTPRLVTGFWFALGNRPRPQLEEYLARYLAFMGPEAGRNLAPHVKVDSPGALRDAVRMVEDLGADEVLLVPTTSDPDEIDRVVEALAL